MNWELVQCLKLVTVQDAEFETGVGPSSFQETGCFFDPRF